MNQTETDALARKLFPGIRSKSRMELANRLIMSIQDKMMFWSIVLERDPREGEFEYNVKLSLDDPDNRVGLEDYAYGFVYDFQDVSIERKSKRMPEGFDPSRLDLIYDLSERIYKVYLHLYQWSLRWGISDKWFLEQGLQTLNLWCRREMTSNWDWAYIPEFLITLSPHRLNFHFKYTQWHPEANSWSFYKKRARKRLLAEFEKVADSYRKQRERAIGKRQRARDKRSEEHFLWLIDFQISGLEISEVVDKYFNHRLDIGHSTGLDYSTVREALQSLATVLPLTLRSKRGKD